jgi:hypothetical protein
MWPVFLRTLLQWSWFDAVASTISFFCAIEFYTYQEEVRRKPQGSLWRTYKTANSISNYVKITAYYVGVYVLQCVTHPPTTANTVGRTTFIHELVHHDGLPWNFTGVVYVLVEAVAGLVLYDAIFFVLHLCMHYPKTREIHRPHHDTHAVLCADSVLQHSAVDALLQVGTNILVQRYNYWTLFLPGYMCTVPKTRLARLLHNILVTWMLTESHANVDVKTQVTFFKRFPRIFPGIQRHRTHHQDPRRYYQQFFGYLDDVLGCLTETITEDGQRSS